MINSKNEFLLEANSIEVSNDETLEVVGNFPCSCCGYITIPNKGDAPCYICPICMWQIDLFIRSEDEQVNLNHGLSLTQARENFKEYGAVLKRLKQYCRVPKKYE